MACLVDTNILVRLANSSDPQYPNAARAILELHRRGEVVHITSQNLIEFRNVATRSITRNGLGLSPHVVEMKAAAFEGTYSLLVDTADIFPAWKGLVTAACVIGKQIHDARLVAVCQVHGVANLLTFNTAGFARLVIGYPGLVVLDAASF
jgi:predicted nucleic acid-binding protein